MDLNELCAEALRIANEHGFKDASVGEDAALMHSEISEMLEDHRVGRLAHEVWYEETIPVYGAAGYPLAIDGSVYVEGGDQKRLTVAIRHDKPFAETDVDCPVCSGRGCHPSPGDGGVVPCKGTGKKLKLYKPCGIPSEMADIVVRVAHFSGKHGVKLREAVAEKMAYNESRPFKHGNKKI